MRLLLTRAEDEAARSRALLEAAGHRVILSPVLRYTSTGEPLPHGAPDAVIATSARAFAHVETPRWDIAAVPLCCVGARTKAAARNAGFAGQATVAPTSAALATILRTKAPSRLLYLAGIDRKPDLENALAAGPHDLHVVETYAAAAFSAIDAAAVRALAAGEIDAVLHYSARSAAIFCGLSRAAALDPCGPTHFCLSADVAAALPAACRVRIAAAPDEAALLALVEPC